MQKYSSYKDSEIKWLDQIPSNWIRSRIRMVGDLYGGLTGKKGDDFNNEENPLNKPFVPFTNIFNNTYISKDHFQLVNVKEDEKQNRVLKNDLFFLMSSESYEDLGKCSILLEDVEELYLNSFCKGYRIKDQRVYPLFLNYQLLGSLHKEMISIEGNGFTRINLRQDRLLDIPVFIPPLTEQQQIVAFLDDKTTKIDNLIEHKQKKIELLKEKRTAIVNHLVTKGLNPNSELKDSGVEWIGEIPNHWKSVRLKHVTDYFKGNAFKSNDFEDNGIPIVKASNIKGLGISKISHYISLNNQREEFENFRLKEGDLIITTVGSKPEVTNSAVGQLGFVNNHFQDSYLNQNNVCFRSHLGINKTYFKYVFMSRYVRSVFDSIAKWIANQAYIEVDRIGEIFLFLPSIEEQQEIVDYLDKQTKEINDLIQLEQQKIELLKEYRQSLISEVVTGKVRVCEEEFLFNR